MSKPKQFIVGIDLHGTLLNDEWQVDPELMEELIAIIDDVKDFCKVVICTGNDFGFIEKYVPEELREHFDGAVLETGCAYREMNGVENGLLKENEQLVIDILTKSLKDNLKDFNLKYFGNRKHSISMFAIDETGGEDPQILLPKVQKIVNQSGLANEVTVTYSSVAVDIFPKRFNKATGLREIADGGITVGIADSMNDFALTNEADIAFLPKNASPELIKKLVNKGKKVVSIDAIKDYNVSDPDVIIQATQNDTRGVIEILRFIRDNLNPNK